MLQPQDNLSCIGHEHAEALCSKLIACGQLPHSILLSGPKGVGKMTFAFRLVRHLLAPPPPAGPSLFGDAMADAPSLNCDTEHPAISRIAGGSHSDVLVIEPELSGQNQTPIIKIDAARKVSSFLSMTAGESAWRIVLIDEAEAMNRNAANALLKIVEEPPKNTLVILVAHHPGKILPTLRSRCRQIHFLPLPKENFTDILSLNKLTLNDQERDALHSLSLGSAGLALDYHERGALQLYEQIVDCFTSYPTRNQSGEQHMSAAVDKQATSGGWGLWCELWERLLYRASLHQAGDMSQPGISMRESQAMQQMAATKPASFWQNLSMESANWTARSLALHLDRKQVIHSIMQMAYGQQPMELR